MEPGYIFVHEPIGDLNKVHALLEGLLKITDIPDSKLGRMKEFARKVQTEYFDR